MVRYRMKTTIEIPNALYTQVKGIAAVRGISVRRFMIEVLEQAVYGGTGAPWMDAWGLMAGEPEALYDVDRAIEDLSTVDPRDWR